MCKKCYVTTPIYYASNTPQIGNCYSTVACDVFARYNRLMNRDTFYLTGMDEHGQKIEEAAKKANIAPQAYVDKIADGTKAIWKALDISYDYFIRTTEAKHEKVVQAVFEKMLANDDIYLGSYSGAYCVSCESFFTKSQLGENDTCPDCGKPTKIVSEESYFLRLKKYEQKLLDYIDQHPDFIIPESRKNEVVSFVKSGLEDLCVSRTSFDWGIKVKSNPKHVVYVWIDALMNYLSALDYPDGQNYKKFWLEDSRVVHVIGKDILRFHAVYWPIMLMALDVPINFQLVAHGWILTKEGKMSKSKGNAVYPEQLYTRYGSDAVRHYLVKELPIGNDGLFSPDRFIERYNTDLANDLGNLVSRSIAMVEKYFGETIPAEFVKTEFDEALEKKAQETIKNACKFYEAFELQKAIEEVSSLVNAANKYIDDTAPWVVAKEEDKKPLLASIMRHLLESLRVIANLYAPVLTKTSPAILEALGLSKDLSLVGLDYKLDGKYMVKKPEALFLRLKKEDEEAYFASLNKVEEKKEEEKQEINIQDFAKMELRVGKILESKKVEGSDKLLVSQIKIGDEVRQIVSGIAKYYNPEEIIGKKVIVVANLAKAKIRGVESCGMVLCASKDDHLELIEVKDLPEGSVVK